MNKVICSIAMSLDAFVAGPNQSSEKPFGDLPENLLHHWMFDEPEKHQAQLDALQDAGAFIIFGSLKVECVGRTIYSSHQQAQLSLFTYLEVYYNRQMRHSTLGYVSPLIYVQRGVQRAKRNV